MSKILHRTSGQTPRVATGGSGAELIGDDGRRYLDACGGAAVSCLGHAHPDVLKALHEQLDKLAYAHTGFFTSEVAERLADRLVEDSPAGLDNVYLVSGGSEGIEAALKMARQHCVERGEPGRRQVIARRQSYHGNTLGALATGGNQARRAMFEPLLSKTHHIDPCYAYRFQESGESAQAYGRRAADQLDAMIEKLGPETVMAFVAEPVVGATAGAVPAVNGYFQRIREICDKHGVLLILDEVMCGMGRTGTLHACEQEGIVPDILVIAKGLGGGYQPIGAVLLSAAIFNSFAEGSGAFQHGHTYIGHPMAAAAGLCVQEIIRRDHLLDNVMAMGDRLQRGLEQRLANHPHVGNIRGRGLFRGIELVADRESKKPFAPESNLHVHIKREAMQRGLMVYPGSGTIDGKYGHHVLLAPPYIIQAEQVDAIVERLADSIDAAVGAHAPLATS